VEVQHPLQDMTRRVPYDQVVIALGGVTSTFGLPGIAEHAFPFKTLDDAETLRNEVIASLELAHVLDDERARRRLLNFTIVGGGFTGVEVAGELIDFLHEVRVFYPRSATESTVTIVEGGERLLPELPPRMGEYTARNLRSRGVDVRRIDDRDGDHRLDGRRTAAAPRRGLARGARQERQRHRSAGLRGSGPAGGMGAG
jgi:NADH dehydrogenase